MMGRWGRKKGVYDKGHGTRLGSAWEAEGQQLLPSHFCMTSCKPLGPVLESTIKLKPSRRDASVESKIIDMVASSGSLS